jgi:hypothetical protein
MTDDDDDDDDDDIKLHLLILASSCPNQRYTYLKQKQTRIQFTEPNIYINLQTV